MKTVKAVSTIVRGKFRGGIKMKEGNQRIMDQKNKINPHFSTSSSPMGIVAS